MRSRPVLALAGLLGLVVVAAAGLQGAASSTGPRWIPDLDVDELPTPPPDVLEEDDLGVGPGPSQVESSSPGVDWLPWTLVAVLVVLIGIVLAWWYWRRRRSTTVRSLEGALEDLGPVAAEVLGEPETLPDAPVLRRGFEHALHVLDSSREPGDAIVEAWMGLEEAAADSGVRRAPAQTPTEFTSRILTRSADVERPVHRLLELYLRVRFGDHPATPADVTEARTCLEELSESWRAAAPRRDGAGTRG